MTLIVWNNIIFLIIIATPHFFSSLICFRSDKWLLKFSFLILIYNLRSNLSYASSKMPHNISYEKEGY
jgi:hypothetical protein